jgi:hypothetical protein
MDSSSFLGTPCIKMIFTFTAVVKATAAKFNFAACCRYAKCSFRVRLHTKKNCNPYFIVIMITVLIMNVIFWVVNLKTQNYFVISTTQNVYLRLSMYDCSNFVYSCRIFGKSELQTV